MTQSTIAQRLNVTPEQIAKAHRYADYSKHQVIYRVESAHEAGTEYTVFYHQVLQHLVCDCKAGQVGTPCWHKRAAVAAAAEFKAELSEQNERDMAELSAEIKAEAERIANAPLQTCTAYEQAQMDAINENRTFRLMR